MQVRNAEESEISQLAQIWYDGWQDAHAEILPEELKRARTLASFTERLAAGLASVRVVGPAGAPLGFSWVKGDELYQLYVSAEARGKGAAALLIADAEALMADAGVRAAWLACAIGNERAARFYEKCGWSANALESTNRPHSRSGRARVFDSVLDTPDGPFHLDVWRYEKALGRAG